VAHVKALLLCNPTGTHEDREQAGFIRGYEACTDELAVSVYSAKIKASTSPQWQRKTFDSITSHQLAYNDQCARAVQRDAIMDVRDRIWGREQVRTLCLQAKSYSNAVVVQCDGGQALSSAPAADQVVSYVHFVIQTVDVLKFAVE